MENLSPGLQLLLDVRAALENGSSVRTGLLNFLKNNRSDFSSLVSSWMLLIDQEQNAGDLLKSLHPCRRALLVLLEKGLRGLPVLGALNDLEREIVQSCEQEIEERVQKLPVLLLLPVLFLMFPAYLLLLLGPILLEILNHAG